jgi:hypothetical protein
LTNRIEELGIYQNSLVSRNRHGWSPDKPIIGGSNQNDIGEARASWGAMSDVEIKRRPETQEGNFSFEIFDLSFKIFFSIACFLVTLFASSGIASAVVLLTRYAPHGFGVGVSLAFCVYPGRCTEVASHRVSLSFMKHRKRRILMSWGWRRRI